MRQLSAARIVAAVLSVLCLSFLSACGGASSSSTPVVNSITLAPSPLSINAGQVAALSAQTLNYAGTAITADVTFTSSNPSLATVSGAGLVCGGTFDANDIVCTPASTAGQATITATSGSASQTVTVYVHPQVDQVVVAPMNGCTSAGKLLNPSASAYNTSASGCSMASPCDITSSVGPFSYGAVDPNVIANASGISPTYSSTTSSPTYQSGGTISGSKGQTCTLSDFSTGATQGINPTFSASSNSPTYQSGGVVSGSAGQTCVLSNFNGVTGATATVTLSDINTIASGTRLTITASGTSGTTAPTTATLNNGTATCSGTANVITSLITTSGSDNVIGAKATVALTSANTIAAGTQLTVTAQGYGAVVAPTSAILGNGSATCSGTANVITTLNTATGLKAGNPGLTSVYASVSGVNSVGTPSLVCPVAYILVHDQNGTGTSFNIAQGGPQSITADVYDTQGQYIQPTLTWSSSPLAAATATVSTVGANAATITGVAAGTASVTATCSTPNCNTNLPPMYSYDVVTATIATSTITTVYAASTQSLSFIPISTSTNAVGTAITLPNYPNSILSAPTGTKVYLGSSSGVMIYDVTAGSISVLTVNGAAITGSVVAISADGNFLLVSDSGSNTTYYVNLTGPTISYSHPLLTSSGAFTPDSNWLLFLTGQQIFRDGVSVAPAVTNLSYAPNNIDLLAQGSLAFITSSSAHSIDVRSTCDQSELQTLSANAPTLILGKPNGAGAVAVDSPGLDVITTSQPSGSCPVVAQSTLNTYDLGAGSFNPHQLFLSTDSSRAWILSDQPRILSFDLNALAPTLIPLANSAIPYTGGITMDGAQLYVGANDNNVHRISVSDKSDAQQIAPGLKNASGNTVPPDLVTVLPH